MSTAEQGNPSAPAVLPRWVPRPRHMRHIGHPPLPHPSPTTRQHRCPPRPWSGLAVWRWSLRPVWGVTVGTVGERAVCRRSAWSVSSASPRTRTVWCVLVRGLALRLGGSPCHNSQYRPSVWPLCVSARARTTVARCGWVRGAVTSPPLGGFWPGPAATSPAVASVAAGGWWRWRREPEAGRTGRTARERRRRRAALWTRRGRPPQPNHHVAPPSSPSAALPVSRPARPVPHPSTPLSHCLRRAAPQTPARGDPGHEGEGC